MKKVRQGSSLVELLAVIVIMGIIAAIAVPTVGGLLKNTRKKAAGADIVSVIETIDLWLMSATPVDKDALPVENHKFVLWPGDGWVGQAFYATASSNTQTIINNFEGKIEFILNDDDSKIERAILSDFIYHKEKYYYGGFENYESGNGSIKCNKEGKSLDDVK